MNNQRGSVYLETLIGFLPVFMFFVGTLQVADASVARLVVEHAATTAARAAVVVLPDDGAYYRDADNNAVHQFRDYRQSDVERAADTILAAQGRLGRSLTNVALDKDSYAERELLTARVTAPYRCWITAFCPAGLTMRASAQLVYQGAKYKYEASTGWATSAANRGLGNITGPRANPNDPNNPDDPNDGTPNDPNNPNDDSPNDPNDPSNPNDPNNPDDPNDGTPNDPNDPSNPNDGTPNDPNDPSNPNDGTPNNPNDGTPNNPGNPNGTPNDPNNPNDPNDGTTRPGDGTTRPGDTDPRPRDPELQRREDRLQRALPPNLRDTPVRIDPSLDGTTVQVRYTHDDRGVITGIEIVAGPDAQPRHIRDHAPTVRTMQRYQGVAGRARALLSRFTSWLTGNPNAGPGSLAWESRREVEKLSGIIESRQRELEDPNLTPERRRELEAELDSYERQLAYHEQVLQTVTNEPGRGYVAAETAHKTQEALERTYPGQDVPNPPAGWHWSVTAGGTPIVVRDQTTDNGQPVESRRYEPGNAPDPNDPFAQFPVVPADVEPPRYRTGEGAIRPDQPVSPAVAARAAERKKALDAATAARDDVRARAQALGITDDVTKAGGDEVIAKAIANETDPNRRKALEDLAAARADLTEKRAKLTRESEQLGNQMAQEYMADNFEGHTQTYPDPKKDYEPGRPGEFDFIYTEGNPPTSIVIVEAKGASSELGSATTPEGKMSQGTPEYMRHIAQQMLGKTTDPAMQKILRDIIAGKKGGPEIRYVLVQAPVSSSGAARPGEASEFDLSQPPPPDPMTNP